MKTREQIISEINRIIQANYYSEDFQLTSEFQAFVAGLSADEKAVLGDVAKERLAEDGSIVDILLCSVVDVPSTVPLMAEKLSVEAETNQITRTLIAALGRYSSDDAYRAVERFLDSDQEGEALRALAGIDFTRTLPALVRRMDKPHHETPILHILHERIKRNGLPNLIDELRQSSATRVAGFGKSLEKILRSKTPAYNPLTAREIDDLVNAFAPS
jgi:hypothetical protein